MMPFSKIRAWRSGPTYACTAAAQTKLSPRYVPFASPPPTMSGTKSTCSTPTVLGFCRTTDLHCAGQRKSKVELVNGSQFAPLRPQASSAGQYVAVHPINASSGVRKDCARAQNANPIIYPIASTTNSHGFVKCRLNLRRGDSIARAKCSLRKEYWRFKRGVGSATYKTLKRVTSQNVIRTGEIDLRAGSTDVVPHA